MKKLFLALLISLVGLSASASNLPSLQGRWEFVITSGDGLPQVNAGFQSTISTYLVQTGNSITNLPALTTDTILADLSDYNNGVFTGSVTKSNNVTLTYTVT